MKLKKVPNKGRGNMMVRSDGLKVFMDADDPVLNQIRRTRPAAEVIVAVAIRRAQQIALNYARTHHPELEPLIESMVSGDLAGFTKPRRLK